MKDLLWQRQDRERKESLANELGISYDELTELEWDEHEEESDGGTPSRWIEFSENSPQDILAKIEDLRDDRIVFLGPSMPSAENYDEPPDTILKVDIRALSDKPSTIDRLGFKDYADALSKFIKSEKTEKPLTIAIDAAWGMGKTTLMKMIKERLSSNTSPRLEQPCFPIVWGRIYNLGEAKMVLYLMTADKSF
jgi:hypothetical protein